MRYFLAGKDNEERKVVGDEMNPAGARWKNPPAVRYHAI
jgi:hypothetical protein